MRDGERESLWGGERNDGSWEIGTCQRGSIFCCEQGRIPDGVHGLVTIVKDGEEKSVGVLELDGGAVRLVRFADSTGVELTPVQD